MRLAKLVLTAAVFLCVSCSHGFAAELRFSISRDGEFPQRVTNAVTTAVPATVSAVSDFPGGAIFYTLDGSPPSFLSTPLNGGIRLTHNATINAIAYNVDFSESVTNQLKVIFADRHVTLADPYESLVTLDPPGGVYASNTVVTATARDGEGWVFENWNSPEHSTNRSIHFVVRNDIRLEPSFVTQLRTAGTTGGHIELSNERPHLFDQVRATAVPDDTHYFAAWAGALSGNENPASFSVTSATQVVSAAFAPLGPDQATLIVDLDGPGDYTVNPHKNVYERGETVQVSYEPPRQDNYLERAYLFSGWTGSIRSSTNPATIVLDENKRLQAKIREIETPQLVGSAPAFGTNGTLYITHGGELQAFAPDLAPLWSISLGPDLLSAPAAGPSGTIFAAGRNGDLFAVSPAGALLWHFVSPEPMAMPIARLPLTVTADETVFCPSVQSSRVYVVKNGVPLSSLAPLPQFGFFFYEVNQQSFPPSAALPLIGPDQVIYTPVTNGFSAGFLNAAPLWTKPGYGPAAIDDNAHLYCVRDDQLVALDANGNSLWTLRVPARTLLIGENHVLFAATALETVAISPEGTILWTSPVTGALAPTDDGGVLAGSATWTPSGGGGVSRGDFALTHLDANGTIVSSILFTRYSTHPSAFNSVILNDTGTAFVTLEETTPQLFDTCTVIPTELRPARSAWPVERGSLQNNGRATFVRPALKAAFTGNLVHLGSSGVSATSILESSADLKVWTAVRTVSSNLDLTIAGTNSLFFRIRRQESPFQ